MVGCAAGVEHPTSASWRDGSLCPPSAHAGGASTGSGAGAHTTSEQRAGCGRMNRSPESGSCAGNPGRPLAPSRLLLESKGPVRREFSRGAGCLAAGLASPAPWPLASRGHLREKLERPKGRPILGPHACPGRSRRPQSECSQVQRPWASWRTGSSRSAV